MNATKNIEASGPYQVSVGKDGQFTHTHTLIKRWRYFFNAPHHLHDLLMILGTQFAVLESTNLDNEMITATIIGNNTGKRFYLDIFGRSISVYPADTDHRTASLELLALLDEINETKPKPADVAKDAFDDKER